MRSARAHCVSRFGAESNGRIRRAYRQNEICAPQMPIRTHRRLSGGKVSLIARHSIDTHSDSAMALNLQAALPDGRRR